jgi:uncharacterized protein (TIGR03435 family)
MALGLTRDLPAAYLAACTEILRATRTNPCPPLVPRDTHVAHGWADSIDAMAASIGSIDGRDIDAHGGHWTIGVGADPRARQALGRDLHAVSPRASSRCRIVRLQGQRVEACAMPPYPDGGYYGGHIAYAWQRDDVTYHITLHGHANEPRVRLMMEALIRRQMTPVARPRFAAVSIERCADARATDQEPLVAGGDGVSVSPGRVMLRCRTIESLAAMAYVQYANGLSHSRFAVSAGGTRVTGGPSWLASDTYTIDATADEAAGRAMMLGPMLQTLLAERFGLRVRYEYRTVPVYELRLVDGWHNRLKAFETGTCLPGDYPREDVEPPLRTGPRQCSSSISSGTLSRLDMEGTTLSELAMFLSTQPFLDRRVSDRTGLPGRYDIGLDFAVASGSDARALERVRASFVSALEGRQSLTLQPARAEAEFLVIDRAQRLTAK